MATVPMSLPNPTVIEDIAPHAGEGEEVFGEIKKAHHDASSSTDEKQIRQRVWGLAARVDKTVTFEEYTHWAQIEREMEEHENKQFKLERGPRNFKNIIKGRFAKGTNIPKRRESVALGDKVTEKDNVAGQAEAANDSSLYAQTHVTDEEWRQAARALRTASWGTVFYLVTTDILGWSGAPFVFASMGYGPGVAIYLIFGAAAAYAGWCIWQTFLGLDSARYPMLSFGDPFLRVYGNRWRQAVNVMQSIQMFLTVAVLNLGLASTLTQIAQGKICFIVVILIISLVGMLSGSIRALQNLSWMCNLAVWLNVANFIIIIVASKHLPIDYDAVFASTSLAPKKPLPVVTFGGPPPAQYSQFAPGFATRFNAVNIMVYAYSGALLFVAFLAEMRHPMDFWKGLFLAQGFICAVYILFGAIVYSGYGQYAISNIGQVVQPYSLQTVGNVLTLVSGLFAIFLYFNIGLKTVYLEVFQEVLHFPSIITKKGRLCWYALGPVYWCVSFVFAGGVPNLTGLVGFVGGLFSINFTYTIPAFLFLGYNCQKCAVLPGEGFDPVTGETTRHDHGMKRWVRGFMKGWLLNSFTLIYVLLGLASSGMGSWAGIESLIAAFGPGGTSASNFGCGQPV